MFWILWSVNKPLPQFPAPLTVSPLQNSLNTTNLPPSKYSAHSKTPQTHTMVARQSRHLESIFQRVAAANKSQEPSWSSKKLLLSTIISRKCPTFECFGVAGAFAEVSKSPERASIAAESSAGFCNDFNSKVTQHAILPSVTLVFLEFMSALIITFLKENTLGLYAYVRTEMSAWGFQNTPFLWLLDLNSHSAVVHKHCIYCAEWLSTEVLLSMLSLLPTAFNGIYENSQWITPWAYNKATSNKTSEQYETKSRNMINVTFSSLCFASSFAVGFTGLPLGRRKITLSFWNGRIIVGHTYARLTSGVYRLRKKLNQSELISLFLTLFTQKSVHDVFSCSVTPTASAVSSLCRQSLLEKQPHAEKIKPRRAGRTPRWHPCVHFVPRVARNHVERKGTITTVHRLLLFSSRPQSQAVHRETLFFHLVFQST